MTREERGWRYWFHEVDLIAARVVELLAGTRSKTGDGDETDETDEALS